jgi:hypothetical protein
MMTIDDAASKCGGKAEDLTPSLLFKVEWTLAWYLFIIVTTLVLSTLEPVT